MQIICDLHAAWSRNNTFVTSGHKNESDHKAGPSIRKAKWVIPLPEFETLLEVPPGSRWGTQAG